MAADDAVRRSILRLGTAGLAAAAATAVLDTRQAAAQSAPNSLLRRVLDRGRLLQGTGFVVAPDLVVTNAHVVAGVETVRL